MTVSDVVSVDASFQKLQINDQEKECSQNVEDEVQSEVYFCEIDITTPCGQSVHILNFGISEPVALIKQQLMDFQETVMYSCYYLTKQDSETGAIIKLEDFVELSTYLTEKSLALTMVLDDYDVKSCRNHVKRFREIISKPPRIKGSKKSSEKNQVSNREKPVKPIQFDEVFKTATLGNFYPEVLTRTGNISNFLPKDVPQLSDTIKSISLSAWNPPPPYRKVAGDLLYLKVISDEGTFNITAMKSGFYINNSTKTTFDPSPQQTAYFSHELFATIFQICPKFRSSWIHIMNLPSVSIIINEDGTTVGALDEIATLYASGKGDEISLYPQWNVPPKEVVFLDPSKDACSHTADMSRLQDDLLDSFGFDERGIPREWNEEFNSIQELPVESIQDRITKAKYVYKSLAEFVESSKSLVSAIIDGLINPFHVGEVEGSKVYLHNGILMTKAVDTKEDSLRVCFGDEAHRKAAGHELKNQKHLLQLEGNGDIRTVLTTIIDFKCDRYLAQTIIAGTLSASETSARLMYGSIEVGSKLHYKSAIKDAMETFGKSLYFKEIRVKAIPSIRHADGSVTSMDSSDGTQKNPTDKSPIRIDDEDEIALDSSTIPFIGPIEGKVLKGTDGRFYALDMFRLTPKDANFVKNRGTELISQQFLEKVEDNITDAYLLRHELISGYIQHQVQTLRQSTFMEAAKLYQSKKQNANKSETDSNKTSSEDSIMEGNEANKSEEELENQVFDKEIIEKLNAIQASNIDLQLNPNVFLGMDSNFDEEELRKDELVACELAKFLFSTELPRLTYQIRLAEAIVFDNTMLVEKLHSLGINMRYLGQLARLAREQEVEDLNLHNEGKQRIHAMPIYWLELLEIEIIARSVKHIIHKYMRENKSVYNSPAETIIAVLNYLLGFAESDVSTAPISTKKNKQSNVVSVSSSLPATMPTVTSKTTNKKKKKTTSTDDEVFSDQVSVFMRNLIQDVIPPAENVTKSRAACLELLQDIIYQRFCHSLILSNGIDAKTSFLQQRISKVTLLRRICQQLGLRVKTRSYNFESSTPFVVDDLIAIVPRFKTCLPEIVSADTRDLLVNSRHFLDQKNIQSAFEYAQEASFWTQQVSSFMEYYLFVTHDMF